jgi:hypothetical protein
MKKKTIKSKKKDLPKPRYFHGEVLCDECSEFVPSTDIFILTEMKNEPMEVISETFLCGKCNFLLTDISNKCCDWVRSQCKDESNE